MEESSVVKFSPRRSDWFWDAAWMYPSPWALLWNMDNLHCPHLVAPSQVVTEHRHSLLQGQALSHWVASVEITLRLLWRLKWDWSKRFCEVKMLLAIQRQVGMYFPLGDGQVHEGIGFNLISISITSMTED